MEEAIVIQINVARNRAMLKFDMDDQQRLEQQYRHRRSLGGRTAHHYQKASSFRSAMMHTSHIDGLLRSLTGPLTLAERLINLAADASDAGFPVAAEHLIHLADQVLDRPAELGS